MGEEDRIVNERLRVSEQEFRRDPVHAMRAEKLHLLGLIESKVINRRHYFFVPQEGA